MENFDSILAGYVLFYRVIRVLLFCVFCEFLVVLMSHWYFYQHFFDLIMVCNNCFPMLIGCRWRFFRGCIWWFICYHWGFCILTSLFIFCWTIGHPFFNVFEESMMVSLLFWFSGGCDGHLLLLSIQAFVFFGFWISHWILNWAHLIICLLVIGIRVICLFMSVFVFCQLFSLNFYDVLNRLLIISVLYGDVWDENSFVSK